MEQWKSQENKKLTAWRLFPKWSSSLGTLVQHRRLSCNEANHVLPPPITLPPWLKVNLCLAWVYFFVSRCPFRSLRPCFLCSRPSLLTAWSGGPAAQQQQAQGKGLSWEGTTSAIAARLSHFRNISITTGSEDGAQESGKRSTCGVSGAAGGYGHLVPEGIRDSSGS